MTGDLSELFIIACCHNLICSTALTRNNFLLPKTEMTLAASYEFYISITAFIHYQF